MGDSRPTHRDLPSSIADFDPQRMRTVGRGTIAPKAYFEALGESDTHPGNWLGVGLEDDLDIGEPLGEGGMGIVFAGTQRTLGRSVAVKLPIGAENAGAHHAVLREARVTGMLEHPGIVPVHALGSDAEGRPAMVMKRIEGVPWADLLDDPRHPLGPPPTGDPLQWHLDILLAVTRAVEFAHSRGVLHRDLKPDNVMIGAFGEVYVLDWGLAVRLGDDGPAEVPRAADIRDVAGTPEYMAPEMAAPERGPLGPATDVYLLGAMLFHVLCGRPPHQANTVMATVVAAFENRLPDFPIEVPDGLADVCRKALATPMTERYPTAQAFRAALEGFLNNRGSFALSAEAYQRLVELARAVGLPAAGADEAEVAARDRRVQQLFTECRFGFRQALREWPGNTEAQTGLQDVLQLMAEYELGRDNLPGAQALVSQMDEPAQELLDKLARGVAHRDAEAEEIRRLRELAQQYDARIGHRTRVAVVVSVGAVWLVQNLVFGYLVRNGIVTDPYPWYFATGALFVVFIAAVIAVFKKQLLVNAASAKLVSAAATLSVALFVHWTVGWARGAPFEAILPYAILISGVVFMLSAVDVDRRYLMSALVQVVGFVGAAFTETYVYEVVAVFGGCGAFLLAISTRDGGRELQAGAVRLAADSDRGS